MVTIATRYGHQGWKCENNEFVDMRSSDPSSFGARETQKENNTGEGGGVSDRGTVRGHRVGRQGSLITTLHPHP